MTTVLIMASWRRHLDPAALGDRRVVVAPFENRTGDPSLDPLGAMARDWIAQGLSRVANRMTHEEWDEWTRGSATRRAGYAGLKRNVAVALGNWGSSDAVRVRSRALSDPDPLVRGHAAWALGRVGSAAAAAALSDRVLVESDPSVLEELSAAMDA
jgi:hypothetical protein